MQKNRGRIAVSGIVCICLLVPVLLNAQAPAAVLKYGKYGCVASKFSNGFYNFIPRGSFIIDKAGNYTYLGREQPSAGKFTVDKNGDLLLTGGFLDKGKAQKTDRPDKFLLVFPTNPDNRWTCTCTEKK